MKLHIENFAKIANADIEINGITVIAGENNTGKSTVGKVLYSLYSAFHDIDFKVKEERKKLKREINDISKSDPDNIEQFNLKEKYNLDDINIEKLKTICSFKNENLLSLVVEKYFKTEFCNQFLSLSKKHETDEKKVEVDNYIDIQKECFYIDNPFVLDNLDNIFKFKGRVQVNITDFVLDNFEVFGHLDFLENKLNKSLSRATTGDLINDALLTERLDEFKNKLVQLTQGDFLEKDNKFVFLESTSNQEIELENLSTGIKALAIILKLIENHDISDNSMIVLDEPEIHLHPKWQIIFAEMLVLLQKEFNLNIVLTSHSPYFISAIEAYSAKHEIANKCKYYLSDLNEENMAVFEDVTRNTDKIYKKLAEPLKELEKIIYGNG